MLGSKSAVKFNYNECIIWVYYLAKAEPTVILISPRQEKSSLTQIDKVHRRSWTFRNKSSSAKAADSNAKKEVIELKTSEVKVSSEKGNEKKKLFSLSRTHSPHPFDTQPPTMDIICRNSYGFALLLLVVFVQGKSRDETFFVERKWNYFAPIYARSACRRFTPLNSPPPHSLADTQFFYSLSRF